MRLVLVLALYVLVAVLVAGPAFREPPRDDFPLSNYPMFSERKDPRVNIQQVVARDEAGQETILPPRFVANEEVMQAAATLRRAMHAGPDALAALCAQIADRVAGSSETALRSAGEVLIFSRRVHAVRYFEGDTRPEHEELLGRCEVRR